MKECAVNVHSCMHSRGRKFSVLYNFIIYITPYPAPLIHIVHISMYIYSNGTHTESHNMLRIYMPLELAWYHITSLSACMQLEYVYSPTVYKSTPLYSQAPWSLPTLYSQFQVDCPIMEERKSKLTNHMQAIPKRQQVWRIWLVSLAFCFAAIGQVTWHWLHTDTCSSWCWMVPRALHTYICTDMQT